jgi:hypothetical protein
LPRGFDRKRNAENIFLKDVGGRALNALNAAMINFIFMKIEIYTNAKTKIAKRKLPLRLELFLKKHARH